MSDLNAIHGQNVRDFRRRTPRVLKAVYAADGSSLTLVFMDDMDDQRETAVVRLCVSSLGVVEFTDFTWSDERTLVSSTPSVVTTFVGAPFVRYMSGDIRGKRRFNLWERTRVDRLEAT